MLEDRITVILVRGSRDSDTHIVLLTKNEDQTL